MVFTLTGLEGILMPSGARYCDETNTNRRPVFTCCVSVLVSHDTGATFPMKGCQMNGIVIFLSTSGVLGKV